MIIRAKPYELQLKHPFSISKYTRLSTPIMLLEIEYEGQIGYGEASMVPYLGESVATANDFLEKVDSSVFNFPFQFDEINNYLDGISIGQPAIKAGIDIALHDLWGKLNNQPCHQMFGSSKLQMPLTTYTIGIDRPEVIVQKVADALSYGFKLLKVKLGRDTDKLLIETIRTATQLPLYVDANQGWTDKKEGLEKAHWLKEMGVTLIEQPMPKDDIDGNAWLSAHSPIPTFGDEAIQRLPDVESAVGVYHGINVKLMKSTGMFEAHQMILKAKSLGLQVLIGCMSETSVATLAGVALAPLCDFADLDGPFLTSNNPFITPEFIDGKYNLPNAVGLGVELAQ